MNSERGFLRVTAVLLGTLMVVAPSFAATVVHTADHTFSLQDIQGGFDGAIVLDDPTIVCGAPIDASPPCPVDATQPIVDSDGDMLYPIDSEFGFIVTDFSGAEEKTIDGLYTEGWVGDLVVGGEQVGLVVSDAPTETFKTPAVFGT